MEYDKVPAAVSVMVTVMAPSVPGPTQNEWAGALLGVLALVVRELVWWARNRRS